MLPALVGEVLCRGEGNTRGDDALDGGIVGLEIRKRDYLMSTNLLPTTYYLRLTFFIVKSSCSSLLTIRDLELRTECSVL